MHLDTAIQNKLSPHADFDAMTADLYAWYKYNQKSYPWRNLWKKTEDPWPVWVSEVMLQQTMIAAVIPKYEAFMRRFPSAADFANASEVEIRPFVSGLGYYRRFALLAKGSKEIVQKKYPANYRQWLEISGIGPYTAAAIASITLREKVGVVDGNVERVLARIFNIQEVVATAYWKKQFFEIMTRLVQHDHPGDINQAVMELGQTVCRVSKPSCDICPLKKYCKAYQKNSQHLAPAPKPPIDYENVFLDVWIYETKTKIFLEHRDGTKLFLKGSLGFPFSRSSKLKNSSFKIVKHSITKYKIAASILLKANQPQSRGKWVEKKDIEAHLISALDLKIWKSYSRSSKI